MTEPDTHEYESGPSVFMDGTSDWIIRRKGKPGIIASVVGHESHAKAAVHALDEVAKRDVWVAGIAQAEARRLAAALHMALFDAHPAYGSTAGWRGGTGGQMVTTGCSVTDPPPAQQFLADALVLVLRDYRDKWGADAQADREAILGQMGEMQAEYLKVRRATAMSRAGVHATHCCTDHGCKYGDDDVCPVKSGDVAQEYPCEWCSAEEEDRQDALRRINPEEKTT